MIKQTGKPWRRAAARSLLAGMLLGAWAFLGAAPQYREPGKKTSPAYTVKVSLRLRSPFVPDARMTFADFAFSAVFRNAVFVLDPYEGAGMKENRDGKLLLTRCVFNDVDNGSGRHKPWLEKPWPKEFPASLAAGWVEKSEEEWDEEYGEDEAESEERDDASRYLPKTVKLGFMARFGHLELEWFSNLGSRALSEMLFEFAVPWKPLLAGQPHTLKLPYEGDYEEDQGEWRIEFIPQKK